VEKAVSATQLECVFVASGIRHAMRNGHIVTCACPALQYFSTLSHKRHDFTKKITEWNRSKHMQEIIRLPVHKTSPTQYHNKISTCFTGTCPTVLAYTTVHPVSAVVKQLQM
jgi:hypothetical protein